MTENDRSYFQRRAEVEARLARQATLPPVARIHQELADIYRRNVASVASDVDKRS